MKFVLIFLLCILTTVKTTWIRDQNNNDESVESSDESHHFTPFSVIMGPINDDSNEQGDRTPIRHHMDFDEMFPGEDQVAMSGEHSHSPNNIWRSHEQPPAPEEDDEENTSDDDLIVPDFSNLFANLPPVGIQQVNDQPWWQLMSLSPSLEWWKGSNVCIKREERDENSISGSGATPSMNTSRSENDNPLFHMQFSACENLDSRYSCVTRLYGPQVTKTVRTDYECCNGYSLDFKIGCKRGHFKNIVLTIQELGGSEFLNLVKHVHGVEHKLVRDNLTVFLPNNQAILSSDSLAIKMGRNIHYRRTRNILRHLDNIPIAVRRRPVDNNRRNSQGEVYPDPVPFDELGEHNNYEGEQNVYVVKKLDSNMIEEDDQIDEKKTLLAETILNHFVSGTLGTDDFVDEKVIYSEKQTNGGGVLRLNTWDVGSEKVKTVNCARLLSPNHRCTNGMVHIVDRVIYPVIDSINDVLGSRPELSVWNSLVSASKEMTSLVRDKSQHLTLLAPTNAALDKVGPALLVKLRSGDSCLRRILARHILPITFCSSIIYGKGQVRNIEHDLLSIERTPDDKLFINGSQIIVRDIVTTNGVVHIIDAVLLSNNDKPMSQVLAQEGFTSFFQAFRRLKLEHELDGMNNVTVFAPNDAAFASLPEVIRNNDEKLRNVLRYHIAFPEVRGCHFSHQQLLYSAIDNAPIRINLYSSFPLGGEVTTTASCGVLRKINIVGCGGVIHNIDRVVLPPTLDLVANIKANPNFSIFSRLLSENEELFGTLRNTTLFFTIFVPNDAAFNDLPNQQLASILNNKEEASRVLKRHITLDSLCCAGVGPNLYFMTKRVATLGDVNVPVYRDPKGQVVFGNALVTTCDLIATNGIIHMVDEVLKVRSEPQSEQVIRTGQLPETFFGGQDAEPIFLRL